VSSYIEEHRERFGVEPICRTLEVSASAYYQRAKGGRSARALEDERLLALIAEIHEANYCATATGGCGSPCSEPARRSAAAGWRG
jgi:putative transposase